LDDSGEFSAGLHNQYILPDIELVPARFLLCEFSPWRDSAT
jgi:hypothetical protein